MTVSASGVIHHGWVQFVIFVFTMTMPAPSPKIPNVAVSEELFAPVSGAVELCYQTFGDPEDDPLLLVMGLGGPMTWWHPDLCRILAARGFFVIRYDNRDTGRSSRIKHRVSRVTIVRAFSGRKVRAPYSLHDLAADAVGLLDHLGIANAHVAGVSMGGMIAQVMAADHPTRVTSLVSIMSTSGKRTVGWAHPLLMPGLVLPRGAGREAYVKGSAAIWKRIGSPAHPEPDEALRERAEVTWDRGFDMDGVLRQMLAILTQPNRSRALHSLRIPATVIHGLADRMVHVSGGRATAQAIPGAELLLIEGMGHDLPHVLHGTFVDAIRRTADRA